MREDDDTWKQSNPIQSWCQARPPHHLIHANEDKQTWSVIMQLAVTGHCPPFWNTLHFVKMRIYNKIQMMTWHSCIQLSLSALLLEWIMANLVCCYRAVTLVLLVSSWTWCIVKRWNDKCNGKNGSCEPDNNRPGLLLSAQESTWCDIPCIVCPCLDPTGWGR